MRDKVTTVSINHNGKETERIVKNNGSWVAGEWREVQWWECGGDWGGGAKSLDRGVHLPSLFV